MNPVLPQLYDWSVVVQETWCTPGLSSMRRWPDSERFDVWPVAVRAFRGRLRIDDHRSPFDRAGLRMALVAGHACMLPSQGEARPGIVIESRGNPALGIVAVGTGGLTSLRKLAGMGVFVAVLTNLRRTFELHLLGSDRCLVTSPASRRAVCSEEWKLGF
jgi:hypothetical protein